MKFEDISVPEIYKSSADFRFFLKWFETCLTKIKDQTENFLDLYDPLRCPESLLWCLGDTIGYKYDDRLPVAFNRLVILYFMSMIRLKGCKDGVTLAAEINLAQFHIIDRGITGYYDTDEEGNTTWVEPKEILSNRLEDTSIPVNSAYVTPHTSEGYIEVVYFSTRKPIDCCIEYVRPVGMYIFQHEGVRYDARTKISVDARLTNTNNLYMSIGSTHVGHYSREDYARMQKVKGGALNTPVDPTNDLIPDGSHSRQSVYYRNSKYEDETDHNINPGYRSLYSLQLANNEHIVRSLIKDPETGKNNPPDAIFSLGYNPIEVGTSVTEPVLEPEYADKPLWNLRYDAGTDREITEETYVNDPSRVSTITSPKPAVNPIMMQVGDAVTNTDDNSLYSEVDDDGNVSVTHK